MRIASISIETGTPLPRPWPGDRRAGPARLRLERLTARVVTQHADSRRISPSAWRPVAERAASPSRASSGADCRAYVAPSASPIITVRLCETMSCISRAIRARSAAAPSRPSWSRSNSSRAARSCSDASSARRCRIETPSTALATPSADQPDPVLGDIARRPPRGGHHRAGLGHDPGDDDRHQRSVKREPVERYEHR